MRKAMFRFQNSLKVCAAAVAATTAHQIRCDKDTRHVDTISWGWGVYGQLGHGGQKDEAAPRAIETLGHVNVKKVISSNTSRASMVLTNEGVPLWFGAVPADKSGFSTSVTSPQQIEYQGKAVSAASFGREHLAAVTQDGCLLTLGSKRSQRIGALGRKSSTPEAPETVAEFADGQVQSVACGARHTIVLTKDGRVFTFGRNFEGACGHPGRGDILSAQEISLQNDRAIQIAAGAEHSLVLTQSGNVFAFGSDDEGQLGLGGRDRYVRQPVHVTSLQNRAITKIVAGSNFSLALTKDGQVYSWGNGKDGQLSHGDRNTIFQPKLIEALQGHQIVDIAAGDGHVLFLTSKGDLLAAGRGRNGQLGREGNLESIAAYRTLPVQVDISNKYRVVDMAAGSDHCLALVTDR